MRRQKGVFASVRAPCHVSRLRVVIADTSKSLFSKGQFLSVRYFSIPAGKRIAKKSGIDRSTVIRYVKKLRELKLISPEWRFKEDGSHTSNQYNFRGTQKRAPSRNIDRSICPQGTEISVLSGGSTIPPEVVVQDNHPGSAPPPKQSPSLNKKHLSITEVDLMPTEKQKTCPHPPEMIMILPDDITICNHCYGLLDEDFKLIEEEKDPEIVAA
jgi:hypothetical protein